MPVSFLNEEQERRYGRYAGEPDPSNWPDTFTLMTQTAPLWRRGAQPDCRAALRCVREDRVASISGLVEAALTAATSLCRSV